VVEVPGPVRTPVAAAEDGPAAGQPGAAAVGRLAGSPAAQPDTALAEPARVRAAELP